MRMYRMQMRMRMSKTQHLPFLKIKHLHHVGSDGILHQDSEGSADTKIVRRHRIAG